MKSPVVKRSIVIAGHKTSVSLEDAFWTGLKEIAAKRDLTLSDMVAAIDQERRQAQYNQDEPSDEQHGLWLLCRELQVKRKAVRPSAPECAPTPVSVKAHQHLSARQPMSLR